MNPRARATGRRTGGAALVLAASLMVAMPARAQCVAATPAWHTMTTREIILLDSHGEPVRLAALIADENAERAAGYQRICPAVVARTAILFVFPRSIRGRFHMRNTYAPLDIAFLDERGVIVDILRMEAEPTGSATPGQLYGPDQPFRYALETPAGFMQAHRLAPGSGRLVAVEP